MNKIMYSNLSIMCLYALNITVLEIVSDKYWRKLWVGVLIWSRVSYYLNPRRLGHRIFMNRLLWVSPSHQQLSMKSKWKQDARHIWSLVTRIGLWREPSSPTPLYVSLDTAGTMTSSRIPEVGISDPHLRYWVAAYKAANNMFHDFFCILLWQLTFFSMQTYRPNEHEIIMTGCGLSTSKWREPCFSRTTVADLTRQSAIAPERSTT